MRKCTFVLATTILLLAMPAFAQISIPAGFPDASTTGIAGVGLTVNDLTVASGRTITVDGTVIDMENITGRLVIQANNVTVSRCRIIGGGAYNIEIDGNYVGTVIEDCLLLGGDSVNVTGKNYTIRRCDISGSHDGLKVNTGCLIEDNYIHDQLKEIGTHNDGIQDSGSLSISSGWVIRHNTIQGPYYASTSAIMVSTDSGYIDDIVIEENFISGGGFSLYCTDHGDGYGAPTNVTIRNNVFEAGSYVNNYITFNGSPDFQGNILHTGDAIAQNPPTNLPPIADAGYDVIVTDTDADGYESITLAPDCHDNDGTIVSYAWSENLASLSTAQTPTLSFGVGSHRVDLSIIDDDGAADTDSLLILVLPASGNQAPIADAGTDLSVTDLDGDGYETITLDGSLSFDGDGSITGYVWEKDSTTVATTATAAVTLPVGSHEVYLTVSDDDSATDIDTITITIEALSLENTYALYAHTLDRVVLSDASAPRPANETTFRVGGGWSVIDGAAIIPFKLPVLHPDEIIVSAELEVDLASITAGVSYNVDLYGLGYRSDARVETTDFYQGIYDGDTTDATALQDNVATPATVPGFVTSNAATAIANWLNAQYAAGAVGGDFVFIRLSPDTDDSGDYKYFKFRSADGSASTPMLTVQTGPDNQPPVADANVDQTVTDFDGTGAEIITLDGSGCTDSDGTIVSYVWSDNGTQIATGASAKIIATVGTHNLTLTVTDDDSATDTDTVVITVNADPTGDQLRTLGQPDDDRFTITDKVWPANPGEADVCLWKDDAMGAVSITIDDNTAVDHDWWVQTAATYDIPVTWFVVSNYMGEPGRGTWDDFEDLYELGHDVQSHTMTHFQPGLGFDPLNPDWITDFAGSQEDISSHIPGADPLTLAVPGGTYEDLYDPDIADEFFIAARGQTSVINKANRTNWMYTKSVSGTLRISGDNVANQLVSIFDSSYDARYYRGWYCCHYHQLDANQKTVLIDGLEYLEDQNDDPDIGVWIGTYRQVALYGQSRDSATLTVTSADASGITFTLTDLMNDAIYTYPLTVKVRLYDTWNDVEAVQNGQPVPVQLIEHNSAMFALVDAVPDQGSVELTPVQTPGITGEAADRSIESDGDLRPSSETSYRIGAYNDTVDTVAVVPFALPTLQANETIVTASLSFNLQQIRTGVTFNVDLYGLAYRSAANVLSSDYYSGSNDSSVTLIQDSFATPSTTLGLVDSDASAALAAYLNAQYATGAVGGDYVFLRINHDIADAAEGDYYTFTSVDGTFPPVLDIEIGQLPANDPPVADAGTDQTVTDIGNDDSEQVTLDGSGCSDADGLIVSYVWKEGSNVIGTGMQPTVTFDVGVHTVDLTVTDDDDDTDTDTVVVIVDAPTCIAVTGEAADRSIESDGDLRPSSETSYRIGAYNDTVDTVAVVPFALPTLQANETIVAASLSFNLQQIRTGVTFNVDLYGLAYRSAANVLSSDYYSGSNDSSGTLIQDSFATPSTTLGLVDSDASAALAAYLNAQYAAGAVGGDYVFLRINHDIADAAEGDYYTFTSVDGTTPPLLDIEIGSSN